MLCHCPTLAGQMDAVRLHRNDYASSKPHQMPFYLFHSYKWMVYWGIPSCSNTQKICIWILNQCKLHTDTNQHHWKFHDGAFYLTVVLKNSTAFYWKFTVTCHLRFAQQAAYCILFIGRHLQQNKSCANPAILAIIWFQSPFLWDECLVSISASYEFIWGCNSLHLLHSIIWQLKFFQWLR